MSLIEEDGEVKYLLLSFRVPPVRWSRLVCRSFVRELRSGPSVGDRGVPLCDTGDHISSTKMTMCLF